MDTGMNSIDPSFLQGHYIIATILGILLIILTLFWLVFPITVYQQLKRTNRLLEQIEEHSRNLEDIPRTRANAS